MIELSTDQLWDCIYASRDSEKYWRQRRRSWTIDDIYSPDDLYQKFQEARSRTQWLESLAPANSW